MTWNNVQPPCNTCVHCAQSSEDHRNHQCLTMPHAAYLHSQVTVLCQLLSMFLANVAISRTADINKKTSVCLLISETDVWTIGFDLPGSGDGGIPHHSNVIRLHKPIRMMLVPSALHWNPKMATNIPMNCVIYFIIYNLLSYYLSFIIYFIYYLLYIQSMSKLLTQFRFTCTIFEKFSSFAIY